MVKFAMDAMHDVLYKDDTIIIQLIAEKCFLKEHEKEDGLYTKIKITMIE